jgi:tetratricopeptide (TPR) repeat protein
MLSPGEPTIMFNLAVVLSQQGYAEEATELLKELRAKQGDHPRYAIAMADVHLGQRRLAQAREELKLAYEAFSQAANWPQAATVARSISNLAFAEGAEQEALCYSYEAFVLDQSATQLGYHASMLVALNLLTTADTFVGEQLALSPSLGALPRVHLARALARGGLKNMTGAVDEIEQAQNLLAQDPEIGAEVNVVWWLFRKQIPETEEDRQDTKLQESLEAIEPEVVRLRDKPTYNMVRWPVAVLGMLYQS